MDTDKLKAYVERRLAEVWPDVDALEVSPPALLATGWESDIYEFACRGQLPNGKPETDSEAGKQGELVARLYFGDGVASKAQREFGVMARLAAQGYACPTPLWLDGPDSPWQRHALIMTRVPGEPMWPLLFNSEPPMREWARATFVGQMVDLHRLDIHAAGLERVLPVPPAARAVVAQVEYTQALAAKLPSIGLENELAWLGEWAARVHPGHVGLAHWDLHPNNVLCTREDDSAVRQVHVIDWSGAELTDTRFDLAWTLVVVGSQVGWDAAEQLGHAYEAAAGAQADLEFFLAFAYARRLYVIALALTHGAEVLGMRPGAEASIRAGLEGVRGLYARWLAISNRTMPALEKILE